MAKRLSLHTYWQVVWSQARKEFVVTATSEMTVLFDVFPHLDEWSLSLMVEMAKAHDLYYGSDYTMERKGNTLVLRGRPGTRKERYESALRNRRRMSPDNRPVLLVYPNGVDSYRL